MTNTKQTDRGKLDLPDYALDDDGTPYVKFPGITAPDFAPDGSMITTNTGKNSRTVRAVRPMPANKQD